MPSISCAWSWTRSSRLSGSTSTACRSTSCAPMTRRAASNGRGFGPPSATAKCGPRCRGEDLARADDGDDVAGVAAAAAGAAGRDRAGDVIAVDLAVGRGRGELVRLAIGVGRRRAAFVARCEAAVDAIAVAVIGDDEHAPFRLRGAGETDAQNGGEADQEYTHDKARLLGGTRPAPTTRMRVNSLRAA